MPFLKETAIPWLMKLFSEAAKLLHLNSKWDSKTRHAYSAEEADLDEFLADDEELNITDEPPVHRDKVSIETETSIVQVAKLEKVPNLYKDSDSVSTFHPITPSASF
jgi:hypothetical protein